MRSTGTNRYHPPEPALVPSNPLTHRAAAAPSRASSGAPLILCDVRVAASRRDFAPKIPARRGWHGVVQLRATAWGRRNEWAEGTGRKSGLVPLRKPSLPPKQSERRQAAESFKESGGIGHPRLRGSPNFQLCGLKTRLDAIVKSGIVSSKVDKFVARTQHVNLKVVRIEKSRKAPRLAFLLPKLTYLYHEYITST